MIKCSSCLYGTQLLRAVATQLLQNKLAQKKVTSMSLSSWNFMRRFKTSKAKEKPFNLILTRTSVVWSGNVTSSSGHGFSCVMSKNYELRRVAKNRCQHLEKLAQKSKNKMILKRESLGGGLRSVGRSSIVSTSEFRIKNWQIINNKYSLKLPNRWKFFVVSIQLVSGKQLKIEITNNDLLIVEMLWLQLIAKAHR